MLPQSTIYPQTYRAAGIYMIRCTANGKAYIGQAMNVRQRWAGHLRTLTRGTANPAFVKDWQTYGPSAFEWTILEEILSYLSMGVQENKWIHFYQTQDPAHGYNRTKYRAIRF